MNNKQHVSDLFGGLALKRRCEKQTLNRIAQDNVRRVCLLFAVGKSSSISGRWLRFIFVYYFRIYF